LIAGAPEGEIGDAFSGRAVFFGFFAKRSLSAERALDGLAVRLGVAHGAYEIGASG
jgi:hypothetical protein